MDVLVGYEKKLGDERLDLLFVVIMSSRRVREKGFDQIGVSSLSLWLFWSPLSKGVEL